MYETDLSRCTMADIDAIKSIEDAEYLFIKGGMSRRDAVSFVGKIQQAVFLDAARKLADLLKKPDLLY